jgi:hypothetical protein
VKILLIFALSASSNIDRVDACPAELVLKVPKLKQAEIRLSNQYAQCMMNPYLPLASNLEAKRNDCVVRRPTRKSEKLTSTLGWVDKMAKNFAGCETNLKVK